MIRLSLLLLTLFSLAPAIAQIIDPVITITTKIANQGSYVTGYDKQFKLIEAGSDLTWTVRNFNNNNSAWDNIRCGSKTGATTATITTDFTIAEAIDKVEVDMSRYKTGASNKMTSMTLIVSPNGDMSDSVSYAADISLLPSTTGTEVTIPIIITDPLENMYYQLCIEMPKVSSEGVFSVNALRYYPLMEEVEGMMCETLDFTDTAAALAAYTGDGNIQPGSEYAETGSNNLNNASFKIGDVGISLSKAAGTIPPRWWESKTITPELRLNPENVMTIETLDERCRLLEVKFLQGNSDSSYYNALEASVTTNLGESELSNHVWTAPDTGAINRLTLVFSDYCRCGSIRITYLLEEDGDSDIDSIATVAMDVDRCAVFFTLNGVKVTSGNNMQPGVYIVRRGVSVTKLIVR